MKKIIKGICAGAAIVMMLAAGGCRKYYSNNYSSPKYWEPYYELREWISPDGVHYWTFNVEGARVVVPRYTSDGEIYVDRR